MIMSFEQYIKNPLGTKNMVFGKREMYYDLYKSKLDKLMLREAGMIKFDLYYTDLNFYIHMKIPSEVVPKFYYDTIIEFWTKDNSIRSTNSLENYNVRFFSNDPSFVFTYLKVFKDNDMFISELSSKAPKLALKKDPKETNPYKIPGYVKSIFFTYLIAKQKLLFVKKNYEFSGKKIKSIKEIIDKVENCEKKIEERQEKGEFIRKENSKRKEKEINDYNKNRPLPTSGMKKHTGVIGTVQKVGSIKNSKITKRVKKI